MNHFGGWCMGPRWSVFALLFWSVIIPSATHAYIYAHHGNTTSFLLFEDLPALFGASLPKDGLMGNLVESHPLNGCTPIEPPPSLTPSSDPNATKFIVLIKRNGCNFDLKVLHAQQAGYKAAIVHNVNSDILINMNYSNESIAEQIFIPSVFTSEYASKVLTHLIIPEQGSYVILKPEFAFPLSYYLIPFTGVVGLIIIVMFVVLMVRCVQYRKRMRKNRLSKEQLKRIPTHRFHKGDDYDVCAICLDDYEEGDKLRILPCSHAYHCKCVDLWLTKTKKTCPVCKQRVTQNNPEHSESDSEEDARERRVAEGAPSEGDSERTPLLGSSNQGQPPESPRAYTGPTTTAQCLASPARCDSPMLSYDDSLPEDTDSERDDAEEDDTSRLISRDGVDV
ncbi:E3 ubiquitin-protein ligase RNF167 [Brachionichthys hirsutus]|uniref:E3 ubiquitin-protein ligase RNF167 n=1 Tax=Brachionichthys hirsutus TaxID=412623 RepID=UPI00360436A8